MSGTAPPPAGGQDQSMDDILASIRRILNEDEAAAQAAEVAEVAQPEAPTAEEPVAPPPPRAPAPEFAPPPVAPSPPPPAISPKPDSLAHQKGNTPRGYFMRLRKM